LSKICYYHVYLSDDMGTWSHMVLETMKAMEDSGLLLALEKIKVTCVTQFDGREKLFSHLMHSDWNVPGTLDIDIDFVKNPWANDQEMLANIEDPKTITENYTYCKMYDDAWESPNNEFLYIHTKGITSTDNLLRRGNAQGFKRYYYWRQYLQWGAIENWEKCSNGLSQAEVAGVNFYRDPSPHFSGSYWWANSMYLTALPNPATKDWWKKLKAKTNDEWLKNCSDRFRDEMWLLCPKDCWDRDGDTQPQRVFNLNPLPQKYNPAAVTLPRAYYE